MPTRQKEKSNMADIRFYHVTTQPLEQAVPALLAKAFAQGHKIVLMCSNAKDVARYDDVLWTARADGFLPHGTEKDGHAALQPLYLTTKPENPNNADMLALCNVHPVPENTDGFSLVCDFLDGQDNESIEAARERWKAYKDAGHTVTYWQQGPQGGWEQKA